MSDQKSNVIERALQIASLGRLKQVGDIANMLMREGYESAHSHLGGAGIKRQLRNAIAAAHAPPKAK